MVLGIVRASTQRYNEHTFFSLILVCWAADVHKSDESNKYKHLRQAAERATQKQPDEIHLIRAPNHQWTNPAAIEPYTTALHAHGFADAGIFTVDVLPVALQFLLKESERMYAVIYEHPKAGIWINFVVLFQDGSSITFTNTRDRGMEKRPGHPTVHVAGAAAGQLYSIAVAQCPRQPRKVLTPESLVTEFEKAWADGIRWRKSRGGISVAEVASVALSRSGQPVRVLRPERIHYIAEQEGKPEAELKNVLRRIFESYSGVTKAYLVSVKYDESPQIWVALCLMSASREMKMLHAIRSIFKSLFRKGNDLDIMFVGDSEAARIEAVCKPFFQCPSE